MFSSVADGKVSRWFKIKITLVKTVHQCLKFDNRYRDGDNIKPEGGSISRGGDLVPRLAIVWA